MPYHIWLYRQICTHTHTPVDDPLAVQILEPTAQLGGVEDGAVLREAGLAHVVDVELEVTAVHQGQYQAQGVLRLVRIRQTHLHTRAQTRKHAHAHTDTHTHTRSRPRKKGQTRFMFTTRVTFLTSVLNL